MLKLADKALGATLPVYEYTTFPRRFVAYRWFKPLLTLAIGFALMLIFQMILIFVAFAWAGDYSMFLDISYENLALFTTGPGVLVLSGGTAVLLPALAIAMLIVQDRPFSSLSSSRGGWSWSAFFKCLLVSLLVYAVPIVIEVFLFPSEGASGKIAFTVAGFILITLLTPFQCAAEEYVFRGFLMQTVGSWTKVPLIAILVQAIAFAAGHPYDIIGVVSIFAGGLMWGVIVWATKGLEATCAAHMVNNLTSFYFVGFGFGVISTEISGVDAAFTIGMDAIYTIIILIISKKTKWFSPTKDGTKKFNDKKGPEYAYKRWVREQRRLGAAQPQSAQPVLINGQWYCPQPQMPTPPRREQYPYPWQSAAHPYPQEQPRTCQPYAPPAGEDLRPEEIPKGLGG